LESFMSWSSFRSPEQAEPDPGASTLGQDSAAAAEPAHLGEQHFAERLALYRHCSAAPDEAAATAPTTGEHLEDRAVWGDAGGEEQCWNGCLPTMMAIQQQGSSSFPVAALSAPGGVLLAADSGLPGREDLISPARSWQAGDSPKGSGRGGAFSGVGDPFNHVSLIEPMSFEEMHRGNEGVEHVHKGASKGPMTEWELSQISTFAAHNSGASGGGTPMNKQSAIDA
jgi:hypothetical protein